MLSSTNHALKVFPSRLGAGLNWRLRTGAMACVGRSLAMALLLFVLAACTQGSSSGSTQSYEAQLANHLKASGATMYGAYWCPHCAEQKELFDKAAAQLPYVECDPQGQDPQPQLCQQKGVQGYPTWEINRQLYPGTRSLDELAQLSGFQSKQSPQPAP